MSDRDVVFVGDVHLDAGDPDLGPFSAWLRALGGDVDTVVLLGDLFNLWIGLPELEGPHHREVLDAIRDVRAAGTAVQYVEGNRDYRIADLHLGRNLDRVTTSGLDVQCGKLRIHAVHGDLANERDRQYRAWRALSRSTPFWWLFRAVPRGRRLAFVEALERRMRRSNLRYKAAFPEADIRRYAAGLLAGGRDAVVLGHFHERHELDARPPSPPGRIVVLPLWKDGRRHLRVRPDGSFLFESSSG